MVKYVQHCYTEQLRREQLQLFSKRMGLLRAAFSDHRKETGRLDRLRTMADACEPEAGDLAYLPEFREVIEAPAEVDVSRETFAQLMMPWPQLVARWTGERKAEFERLMLPALKGTLAVAAKDILDLAVATFSCYKCWGVRLRWPAVLNHPCFRPQSQGPSEDAVGTEFDRAVYTTRSYWDVFSIKPACVGVHFSRTRSTIRVCGQDPDTVTWETMQADSARLMCKLCSTVDRCQIFDWVAAVSGFGNFLLNLQDSDDPSTRLYTKLNIGTTSLILTKWYGCAFPRIRPCKPASSQKRSMHRLGTRSRTPLTANIILPAPCALTIKSSIRSLCRSTSRRGKFVPL